MQTAMIKIMAFRLFVLGLLFEASCNAQQSVPEIVQPAAIEVVVYPVPILGIEKQKSVEIRPEDVKSIFRLIKPERGTEGNIDKSVNPLIACVTLKYADKNKIKLYVRWMGKNPLATSLNDAKYYWCKVPGRRDGGVELVRVIKKY